MNQEVLPSDPDQPFEVNGIKFANRKDYDRRLEEDLDKFAKLIYDIYIDKKQSDYRLSSAD